MGFVIVGLAIAVLVRDFVGSAPDINAGKEGKVVQEIQPLTRLSDILKKTHPDKLDERKMVEAGIRGMLKEVQVNDPNTVYYDAQELRAFKEKIEGYVGIGANVGMKKVENGRRLFLARVMPGSPAEVAGMKGGDVVWAVDGVDTLNLSSKDVTDQIKGQGEADTVVVLSIEREGEGFLDVPVVRDWIKSPTVRSIFRHRDRQWEYMFDRSHGIGYVRLLQFSGRSAAELRDVVLHAFDGGELRGLILDLRGNTGGLLQGAVDVCDVFLEEGLEVVSTVDRSGARTVRRTQRADLTGGIPLVVLIDGQSASASEIVAGALQDHGRAKILGTRSFGKGSVQEMHDLGFGLGAVKVTNAYYYLPTGRSIHRRGNKNMQSQSQEADHWGVDPDEGYYIELDYEAKRARDADLVEIAKPRDVGAMAPKDLSGQWVKEHLADVQLAGAVKTLRAVLDTGKWLEVGRRGVKELAIMRAAINKKIRFLRLHKERSEELAKEILADEKRFRRKG